PSGRFFGGDAPETSAPSSRRTSDESCRGCGHGRDPSDRRKARSRPGVAGAHLRGDPARHRVCGKRRPANTPRAFEQAKQEMSPMLPTSEVRIVEERGRLWVFVATNAHTDSFLAALGASGATEAVEVVEPFLDPTRVLGGSGYWVGLPRCLGL